jgi:hypothetical protein
MSKILKKNKKFIILFSVSLALMFGVGFALPVWAQKASLYLSPSTGSYTVGNTFLVQVKVNSGGVAINAADGTLVFDPDKLEVKSISKEDSIFTLWVQEPTFSNSVGTINFGGGKPSPGFTGAAGMIINITFKAKTSGTANVSFASGSVLADDGKGTNILTNMGSGTYNLTAREITPLPEERYLPGARPAAPIVSSPTHPDENKWYSNNDPEFSWQLAEGVTKISYAVDQNPTNNPQFIAETLIDKVSFTDLEDGIWYFHINFKNQYGWGPLTHRKVLIDTTLPLPFEIEVQREDPTDPQPVLLFETIDELSGIEYYEVKIGEGEPFRLSSSYKLPPQAPGKHQILVKAFDKAGNYTSASTEIEILPIETPIITKYPKRINIGEKAILGGKSLPELTILVSIKEKGEEPGIGETKADGEGNWAFTSKPLEKGDYQVWVQARDKRGALSLPSSKISFEVGLPPFLKFGKIAIDYLSIMTTLIILIVAALGVIFYGWYQISLWRKKLRRETKELAQAILNAFKALHEEVQEQIEYLDGKPGLTEDEKKVRDELKKALDISEEFIGKELRDVEKELE